MTHLQAAWAAVHDNTPDGWYVGNPGYEPERRQWSMYAFDRTPSAKPLAEGRTAKQVKHDEDRRDEQADDDDAGEDGADRKQPILPAVPGGGCLLTIAYGGHPQYQEDEAQDWHRDDDANQQARESKTVGGKRSRE